MNDIECIFEQIEISEKFEPCDVLEWLVHFDGIVPSLAYFLTKQYGVRGGKHLLKTAGNAISETQNDPRCLSPQEIVPSVRVLKPPTIHYQPAFS